MARPWPATTSVLPDDVIFVGSPGVGVDHASQLGIPPSHVWAGANAHDPVTYAPAQSSLPGMVSDEPGLNPAFSVPGPRQPGSVHTGWFGTDPATPAFGGQIFDATSGTDETYSGPSFDSHSHYWDSNSSSLKSMSLIVDGKYGAVGKAK